MSWDALHFLYPQWLWAIIPVTLFTLWWWQRGGGSSTQHDWARHVDAHLLKHLGVADTQGKSSLWLSLMTFFAALATIIALAGPAWIQEKVPTFDETSASVIVLSLAQSMNSDDIKPSRLKRAEHKIRDILARTQGDDRGLVIYSDTAFVTSPLTNDAKIIEQMLPELSTDLMPVLGNQLSSAIDSAVGMLTRGKAKNGRIIVLTDSAGDDIKSSDVAVQKAKKAGYQVSIIAVGTEDGALLQTADGRAIPNENGQTITTKLSVDELTQLAISGGGVMHMITADDNDINAIFALDSGVKTKSEEQAVKADTWQNQGYWFLFLPLLILPLYFQRGLLCVMTLVMAGFTFFPESALAADKKSSSKNTAQSSVWDNFWNTPNQRGQNAFDQGNYNQAAQNFENKEWQASSHFKSGDYKSAAQQFDALGKYYNKGNALAQTGQLELAADAYKQALKEDPNDQEAQKALDIVNKIMEDQNKQDQNKQDQNKQDQNKQDQNKQDQKFGGSDQKNKDDEATKKEIEQLLNWENNAEKEQADKPKDKKNVRTRRPLDQATEQQLRRVPDDPSGLLRARIYQHYRQQQMGQ
ncbi:MAG: VWA domain-containing protein [Gammaproteobacteria bacterium]|nr:VWA domain-containing protein [Gammaproteobacteria bacterium]